jgi:hypothetical protein
LREPVVGAPLFSVKGGSKLLGLSESSDDSDAKRGQGDLQLLSRENSSPAAIEDCPALFFLLISHPTFRIPRHASPHFLTSPVDSSYLLLGLRGTTPDVHTSLSELTSGSK